MDIKQVIISFHDIISTIRFNNRVCIPTDLTLQWCAVVVWWSVGLSGATTVVRNHLLPFRNLGNFVHPILPVSFGIDTKNHMSVLFGVFVKRSKSSHTGGKCVPFLIHSHCKSIHDAAQSNLLTTSQENYI